jgi:hypothetical protein
MSNKNTEYPLKEWAASLSPKENDAVRLGQLLHRVNRDIGTRELSLDNVEQWYLGIAIDLAEIGTLVNQMTLEWNDVVLMREARRRVAQCAPAMT